MGMGWGEEVEVEGRREGEGEKRKGVLALSSFSTDGQMQSSFIHFLLLPLYAVSLFDLFSSYVQFEQRVNLWCRNRATRLQVATDRWMRPFSCLV